MINFIRTLIKTLIGTGDRYFTGQGRPDETISGKMYQHYGFRSIPIENCELMTVQYGNNNVSVAENDGNLLATSSSTVAGDVTVYSVHDTKINVIGLHSDQLNIQSDTIITIRIRDKTKNVVLGYMPDNPGPLDALPMSLITVNFVNAGYNLHTHGSVGSPTVPITGVPITPPEIPTAPWNTTYTGAN